MAVFRIVGLAMKADRFFGLPTSYSKIAHRSTSPEALRKELPGNYRGLSASIVIRTASIELNHVS